MLFNLWCLVFEPQLFVQERPIKDMMTTYLTGVAFRSWPRTESSVKVFARANKVDGLLHVDRVQPVQQRQTCNGAERKSKMCQN